jgi:hypothetical protein
MPPLRLFEKRPEHPLAERGELERVLAGLKISAPADALQEIAHWLGTLRDFDGFACDDRLLLVKSLDDAARALVEKIFAAFYAGAHTRDRSEQQRESLLEAYWTNLSGAYARCVADNERQEKRWKEIRAELPLALGRCYRAAQRAAKVRCMLYRPLKVDWLPLYRLLSFAELAHFATEPVHVYAREVRSTARAELAKLLGFCVSVPQELPPEQIELTARVLDRFAISFAWSAAPDEHSTHAIDLAAGGAPRRIAGDEPAAPRRYFGAGPALKKLAELEQLSAHNLLTDEMRFGPEFSPTQIVTVIRHFLRYAGEKPPRRAAQRTAGAGTLEVVRGFAAICQRVTAVDISSNAALQEDLEVARAKAREKQALTVAADEVEAVPETWRLVDRSEWGMGCAVPAGLGGWAEPGVLCGIREKPTDHWGVAIIRRLDADAAGAQRCGLQLLSKKPVSVWLRVLGREGQEVSNWESSSGSFSYDYARAIVLADAPKVDNHPVLLLEGGRFVPEQICEVVMGEHSRHLKLGEFLEQGSDYLRAAFGWMVAGTSSRSSGKPGG